MRWRVIFCFILGLVTLCSNADTQNLNSVVAIVNDSVITQTEFERALKGATEQLEASKNPEALDDAHLRDLVLQQLIDEKLELELAKRANISITNTQLNEAIHHIADGNHLTVNQLKAELVRRGASLAEYERIIRRQMLIHQLQQTMLSSRVHVSSKDIAEARQKFQAMRANAQQQYHVIDNVSENKKDAEEILATLKAGKMVDDSKDLGWRTQENLPTLFTEQLKNMKTGDIVGPIQAPNGFHVIQLVGTHGETAPTLTNVMLQNIAYEIAFQKELKKWLVEMRKTAYIKIINQ